jgi:hypothetical protein
MFVWLIRHQPAVLFSQNKPTISNQPAVVFSQNKSAPATSQTNRLVVLNAMLKDQLHYSPALQAGS